MSQAVSLKFCSVTRRNEILLIIAKLFGLSWNFLFYRCPEVHGALKTQKQATHMTRVHDKLPATWRQGPVLSSFHPTQTLTASSVTAVRNLSIFRLVYFTLLSGVPRNFVRGGGGVGCSTNSVEDRGQRERGSGGCSPLVRGSGGSCNFVQEISFQIIKFS